jgi:hypothetical protein
LISLTESFRAIVLPFNKPGSVWSEVTRLVKSEVCGANLGVDEIGPGRHGVVGLSDRVLLEGDLRSLRSASMFCCS